MKHSNDNGLLEDFEKGSKARQIPSASLYAHRLATAEAHFKKTPQAVFKVMSFAEGRGQVNNILYYISQEGTLSLEDENGAKWTEAEAIEISEEWAIDYGHRKPQPPKTKFVITDATQDINSVLTEVKTQLAQSAIEVRYTVTKTRTKNTKVNVLFDRELTEREIENLNIRLRAKTGDNVVIDITTTQPQVQRDAVHLLFSSPKGTSTSVVTDAARRYLDQAFSDYRYFFATHKDTHNHVHVVLKMVDNHGHRLTLNKAKLMDIRLGYAAVAREVGMNVQASYRSERGVGQKGDKGKVRQMRDRLESETQHEKPAVDLGRDARALARFNRGDIENLEIWEIKALQKNQTERAIYQEAAEYYQKNANAALSSQDKRDFIAKAKVLNKMADEMPTPQSREQVAVQALSQQRQHSRDKERPDIER